jgi:intracellular multiplication protein IcmO
MSLDQRKYEHKHVSILRDVRPLTVRIADALSTPSYSAAIFVSAASAIYMNSWALAFADLILLLMGLYFLWLLSLDRAIVFKLPMGSKYKDSHNSGPGKNGRAEGILFLGNVEKTGEEVWFTNSDARTHILYLGTTGAGKTEGLKSMVTNALAWGSGFVYVDGKADTDLWSSLSALVRRFGRDDDLLVLNYMTGNSNVKAPSNTMNPFSSGSASYLTNMLVSLMPESQGDNAMWSERAISLVSAMMPILCWKRDNQDIPLSVRILRDHLSLNKVISLARDQAVPEELRSGVKGYLDTLPGFNPAAYDDQGQIKPPEGGGPPPDTQTASQQHGYLAMQFTRSLQSLGDDYGYIFDTQAADVDMVDVVLNRRILVVLIPALEKSSDEIANLGKIVAATMKGMMGSALGSSVEGSSETVIENKPTHSSTPFMTVFDEVGYYTAQGMAVMAAQARSLGFCLIFSGQDLPAMKKRVREEANSITANCNIKIFGKLEDPTETKEFFEKTVGQAIVTEVSGFQTSGGSKSYHDTKQAGVQLRPRSSYDGLRGFTEGQAVITFGESVVDCKVFYCNPGHAKAMRVTRFLALPPPDDEVVKHAGEITKLRDLMVNKSWTAKRADVDVPTPPEIQALVDGFKIGEKSQSIVDTGITAVVQVHALNGPIEAAPPPQKVQSTGGAAPSVTPPVTPPLSAAPPPATQSTPVSPLSPLAKKPGTPPVTPASQTPAAPPLTAKPPETKAPPASDSKNWADIMGLGKATAKPEAAKPASPPAAPPVSTQPAAPPPVAKGPETPPPQPPATPEAKAPAPQPEKPLPQEIYDILENAAKNFKSALFKDKDNIDAAE